MNKKILIAGPLGILLISGCYPLSDEFIYSEKLDKFSGLKIFQAVASQNGDVDNEAVLQITISCSYNSGGSADAINDTEIFFLVTDKKENPYQLSDISYKIDNGPIVSYDQIGLFDYSEYKNEVAFKLIDLKMIESLIDPETKKTILSAKATHDVALGLGSENDYVGSLYGIFLTALKDSTYHYKDIIDFSNQYEREQFDKKNNIYQKLKLNLNSSFRIDQEMKNISVRYETKDGMVNTANFIAESGNFKSVLRECGWGEMERKYDSIISQFDQKIKERDSKISHEFKNDSQI